jgi:2-deoxy-scyllo-inosamine dehydrogenase (SAM-dependent)
MSRYWRKKKAREKKVALPQVDIPQSVSIEIGARCNRRCPWCPQSGKLRRTENLFLPDELFYKIIDELATIDYAGSVNFHNFNEPLLDSRLVQFVAYARSKLPKAMLYFHTNGDLLTFDLWKQLWKAGLSKIHVNQYDGKVFPHIRNIYDQLTPEEKQIFGVHRWSNRGVCNRAGLVKTSTKTPLAKRCRRMRQLCIDYRGNTVLCCNDYLGAVSVGNIKNKSAIELYNDPLMKHYRHKLRFGRRAGLKLCDQCDL